LDKITDEDKKKLKAEFDEKNEIVLNIDGK